MIALAGFFVMLGLVALGWFLNDALRQLAGAPALRKMAAEAMAAAKLEVLQSFWAKYGPTLEAVAQRHGELDRARAAAYEARPTGAASPPVKPEASHKPRRPRKRKA